MRSILTIDVQRITKSDGVGSAMSPLAAVRSEAAIRRHAKRTEEFRKFA